MKCGLKALPVIATLALAVVSGAQSGRQLRQSMFGGWPTRQSEIQLLGRADVQRELALTNDQLKAVGELQERFGRGRRGQRQTGQDNDPNQTRRRGQGGQGQDGQGQNGQGQNGQGQGGQRRGGQMTDEQRKAAEEARAKRVAEVKAALASILTPPQLARLEEISLQMAGPSALWNPELQTKLGFSDVQREKARKVQSNLQDAQRGLFEKMRSRELDQEGMRAAFARNQEILKEEMMKILDDKQKAAYAKMQGKPFQADGQS